MVRLEANGGTYINASGHSLGPYVIALEPVGHSANGRAGFKAHGDNIHQNYSASEGCIIAPPHVRRKMWEEVENEPLIEVVF
jgi:hypothetical protein